MFRYTLQYMILYLLEMKRSHRKLAQRFVFLLLLNKLSQLLKHHLPTMRHVRGLAEAFAGAPLGLPDEPPDYTHWVSTLIDLADRTRRDARAAKENR